MHSLDHWGRKGKERRGRERHLRARESRKLPVLVKLMFPAVGQMAERTGTNRRLGPALWSSVCGPSLIDDHQRAFSDAAARPSTRAHISSRRKRASEQTRGRSRHTRSCGGRGWGLTCAVGDLEFGPPRPWRLSVRRRDQIDKTYVDAIEMRPLFTFDFCFRSRRRLGMWNRSKLIDISMYTLC